MLVNPDSFGTHRLLKNGLIPKPDTQEQLNIFKIPPNTRHVITYVRTSATPKSHIFTV